MLARMAIVLGLKWSIALSIPLTLRDFCLLRSTNPARQMVASKAPSLPIMGSLHVHVCPTLERYLKQTSWQGWTPSFSTWATRPPMTWCPSTFTPTTWGRTGSSYLSPYGARCFGSMLQSSCTGTRSSLLSEWFDTGSHTCLCEHEWVPHPEQVHVMWPFIQNWEMSFLVEIHRLANWNTAILWTYFLAKSGPAIRL